MIFEQYVKIHYWLQGKYDQRNLLNSTIKHMHNTLIKIHISIRIQEYYTMHSQFYRIQIHSYKNYSCYCIVHKLITIPCTPDQTIHLIKKQTFKDQLSSHQLLDSWSLLPSAAWLLYPTFPVAELKIRSTPVMKHRGNQIIKLTSSNSKTKSTKVCLSTYILL